MNQKLHILFLCSWYPSKVLPTNGDFIQRHAEAVCSQHNVSVLHIISDKNTQKNRIDFQTINNVKTYIGYLKFTKNSLLKLLRYFKIYKDILRKIGAFDVIHVNTLFPFGLFAIHQKVIYKKPFIISEHWTGYQKPQSKQVSFIEKHISKIIVKKASFVCPVSNNLKKSMCDFGLKGNYVLVPNVVDTSIFKPSKKKENNFTIVHVSSLKDKHKNISGMIKVAKELETTIKNFTWYFIGGTSENYEKLISDLQFKTAKIKFINHLSQKELATHLQEATICVSFSNYETFGVVMPEAIACGTYVTSTKTGILTELTPQDFFSIIPLKDKVSLAKEIIKQHKNPTILYPEKMHLYIKKAFSQEVISDAFSNLYFKSLNNNS